MGKTSRTPLVLLGNILYHFDQALFFLLTPFLAPLFFPQVDPVYALIYMYAIAPLSLLAKPLGAFIFGSLGDRIGRSKVLSVTLMGMAVKTGLMGFLPTYSQVGFAAPLLLAFTRLSLSFFAAGETTGGTIVLLDNTKEKKRNLLSSFFDASGILGTLLASLAIWLLHSHEGFWRILFWSGGVVGIIGWFFRKLPDEVVDRPKLSSWQALWEHRSALFAVASVAGFSYANYYMITTFMNGFLPLISSITKAEAMSINTLLLTVDFFLLPLFGWISLKVRKETLILIAIFGIALLAAPLFLLLQEATLFKAACVRLSLTVFGVCLAAPYHAWVYERTPPKHRYLIGAVGTAIGGKLFGSPIPAMALWIFHRTGSYMATALPLIGVATFPLLAFLQEKIYLRAASRRV